MFYQTSTHGRFQYNFKSSIDLGSKMLPVLSPFRAQPSILSPSDKLCKKILNELQKAVQRKHLTSNPSGSLEDLKIGKKTYEIANQQSQNLCDVEDIMQRKIRVNEFMKKRNEIPVKVLGDKIYAYPEFESDFFKQEFGFIPGSNIKKRPRYPYKISKKFHG